MNALAARRRHPAAIAILLLLGPGGHRRRLRRSSRPQAGAGRRGVRATTSSDGQEAVPGQLRHLPRPQRPGHARPARAWSASAPPRSTSRWAPAACRWPAPGVQAHAQEESSSPRSRSTQLAAYVASLAPGPAIPDRRARRPGEGGDIAKGGELFRVNCAMCHNFAGSGGALTRGKYAPSLRDVDARSTSTRPWSPARSRCRCSTTRTSPPRTRSDIIALPARPSTAEREPRRPEPRQPRPGLRGTVRLDLRPRHPDRLRRLARLEGRVTMTRPSPVPTATHHANRQDRHTMSDNGTPSSRAATAADAGDHGVARAARPGTHRGTAAPAAVRRPGPARRTCTAMADLDEKAAKRAERQVATLFTHLDRWPRCCSSSPTSRSPRPTAPSSPTSARPARSTSPSASPWASACSASASAPCTGPRR